MLKTKQIHGKCFRLLVLATCICFANARQIRYNRYNTEVLDDEVENQNNTYIHESPAEDGIEIEATVREIKFAPYPPSGFRPSKEFLLPGEGTEENVRGDSETQTVDGSTIASSTDTIDFTSTTQEYESETTTLSNIGKFILKKKESGGMEAAQRVESAFGEAREQKPYPAAGFQPRVPFLLPTRKQPQVSARTANGSNYELLSNRFTNFVYPSVDYRSSKALEQQKLRDDTTVNANSENDNSNHPVCGSSTNPLSPKPLNGGTSDPDSESISINTDKKIGSRVQRSSNPLRLIIHPLLLNRPLVSNAPIPFSW